MTRSMCRTIMILLQCQYWYWCCPRGGWQPRRALRWGQTFLNTKWSDSCGGIMPSKQVTFVFVLFEASLEEFYPQNRWKSSKQAQIQKWIESVQKSISYGREKNECMYCVLFVFVYLILLCVVFLTIWRQAQIEKSRIESVQISAASTRQERPTTSLGMRSCALWFLSRHICTFNFDVYICTLYHIYLFCVLYTFYIC